jgi:hypothetical protein
MVFEARRYMVANTTEMKEKGGMRILTVSTVDTIKEVLPQQQRLHTLARGAPLE